MSVSQTSFATDYNGATSGTPLACDFPADSAQDIFLATLLIGGTDFVNVDPADYVVNDLGAGNFSVTPSLTYASGITVRVYRWLSYSQPFVFSQNGDLPAARIEAMGDRCVELIQQVRGELGLDVAAVTLPPGSTFIATTTTFANSTARGNATPAFLGQLGIQTNTGSLYRGSSLAAGGWTIIATGAGGDFFGPGSSVANRLVTFADTTGKLGEDASGITALAGALAGVSSMTGGAGNMTILAGTGNSRTLSLQTTTGGGTPMDTLVLNADQTATMSHGGLTATSLATSGNGSVAIAGSGTVNFSGTSVQLSAAVASTLFTNATKFQLGGINSGFPMLKRNAFGIDFRVADDSGYAPVNSLYQRFGSGTPEGVVTAPVGATFSRTDGGAGTSFYVKETGSGNTGWVGK